jgi:murein DD-endopeptidase MepM/ murein hydrolase activator NlpD
MVCTTTREGRGERWRFFNIVAAAVLAFSTVQYVSIADATAQVVKPPVKKLVHKPPSKAAKQDPADTQEADQLNAKWLADHNAAEATAAASTATAAPTAGTPANAPGTAPTSAIVAGEEDKFSTVPSFGAPVGNGARAVVPGTVSLVKATSTAAFNTIPGGSSLSSFKEVAQAFSGFGPAGPGPKVEMVKGQTADGSTRLLFASIGDGKSKQTYWWFAPSDQPEGWFDDKGNRLGGTVLAEPKPDSRISSPFGTRRYYGRVTSAAFHNGIDFEAKMGDPIHAAADGVVNHANWYYNYGRTVKITHADNFETLYAHMSRIAPGMAPGTVVHKGDIIGYVGSTGRSTGPHLHFSTIVNGQFVDPAQFLSENGNGQLNADALVSFRQWQQDIRTATQSIKAVNAPTTAVPNGLHGGEEQQSPPSWSSSPFGPKSATSGVGHL